MIRRQQFTKVTGEVINLKFHLRSIAFLILMSTLVLSIAIWVGAGTTGIISGVVKNADGSPLSGANVFVSGTQLSAVTDAKGYFAITNVPPGEYEVRTEMVGYAAQTIGGIQVTMDGTAAADFSMKQEAIVEASTTITRPRPMISTDVPNTLVQITATQDTLTRLDPSSLHAVTTAMTAEPGVLLDPGGSGQMHLRGGRTDGTGYYIEGIPITDPNTGFFSSNLFSTGVNKFQMYTGGFGAEYGNAVAGVLNEVKKSGDNSSGMSFLTEGGGQSYASEYAQIGGGEPGKFNYYVGSVLQRNDIEGNPFITDQRYSDNTVKVVFPKKNDTFTVLAMQGSLIGHTPDYHDVGNNEVPTPHEKDFLQQRYLISALTWSHNFSSESFITVRPYYIYSSTLQNVMASGYFMDMWSAQRGLMLSYTNKLNDRHLLKAGASMLQSNNNYYVFMPDSFYAPDPNPYHYQSDVPTFQNAFYAEDTMNLGKNWLVQAGLRRDAIKYDRKGLQYDGSTTPGTYSGAPVPDATEATVTPRLGVTYTADPRTVIKANWGKYSKFTPSAVTQKIYYNPDGEIFRAGVGATDPEISTEYEISFEKQVSDSTSYRITPFWAEYKDMTQAWQDSDGRAYYTSFGKGDSKGIEFLVRRRMTENLEGWLAYTYQEAKANSSSSGDAVTGGDAQQYWAAWDQRHTFSLVTNYKTGNWAHSVRADYGSGRADIASPGMSADGQGRSRPYFVMSYNLSVNLPKSSSWGDSINLSIYNLFNNSQALQYSYYAEPGFSARDLGAWLPSRQVSLGISKAF